MFEPGPLQGDDRPPMFSPSGGSAPGCIEETTMTPDERTLLTQFLSDLGQTQGVAKDSEAASMIDNAIRANPDSAYVLVQHALLADQALHDAQAQIAQLKAQNQPPPQPSSFLGGAGLGPSVAQPQYQGQAQSSWGQAAQQPPQPQQSFFGGGPFAGGGPFSGGGGGLGSFLRTAGTTAAGVAGGEMLFSGLSGLFGGHHGGGFGGFGGGGFGGGGETVINNYNDDGGYDDRGGGYDGDNGDRGGDDYS